MRRKLLKIEWILMDVDGVMTDGSITYTSSGEETKTFNAQDGAGVNLAHLAGLHTGIITGRKSEMVKRRILDLKYDFFRDGVFRKTDIYQEFKKKFKVTDEKICYMGDDFADLGVLLKAGLSVAPSNARDEIKAVCDFVTLAPGGSGAVRELIDKILKAQGKLFTLFETFKEL